MYGSSPNMRLNQSMLNQNASAATPAVPAVPSTTGGAAAPATPAIPASALQAAAAASASPNADWRNQMSSWRDARPQRPEDYTGGWGRSDAMTSWRDARPQNMGGGAPEGMGGGRPSWAGQPGGPNGMGQGMTGQGMNTQMRAFQGQRPQYTQGGDQDISSFLASLSNWRGQRPVR